LADRHLDVGSPIELTIRDPGAIPDQETAPETINSASVAFENYPAGTNAWANNPVRPDLIRIK
jgi:hypothetical protein